MRDRNEEGYLAFLWDTALMSGVFLFAFWRMGPCRFVSPITGEQLELGASVRLLVILVAAAEVVCYLATSARQRRYSTALANAALPFAIYSFCCVRPYWGWKWLAVLIVLCLLLAGLALSSILTPAPRHWSWWELVRSRLRFFVSRGRLAALVCCFGALVTVVSNGLFGIPVLTADSVERTENGVEVDENRLVCLNEELWAELDEQERLDVLGVVVQAESAYLGTPDVPPLHGAYLGGYTVGQYDWEKSTITMDLQLLNQASAAECVDAVLHEAYHHYQQCLVECYTALETEYRGLLAFRRIPEYIEETEHYQTEGMDYYNQDLERDARDHAAYRAEYYLYLAEELAGKE
ncbi:hypothetical protein [uncultured Pseudoflavonifractor sp.]|uniref:hypothetical protein n=1 Tax=uncultured Pseudoflavonifractor sp. TaxID=1221379 RepID=UPI0025F5544C|nr:hypothetical protein [uncultured Pseudoflavonifractor sp.]